MAACYVLIGIFSGMASKRDIYAFNDLETPIIMILVVWFHPDIPSFIYMDDLNNKRITNERYNVCTYICIICMCVCMNPQLCFDF